MTYYHATKAIAQGVADTLATDPRVARTHVMLEPYNGWMVTVQPCVIDILDLGDVAEVQHPDGHHLTPPPPNRRRAPRHTAVTVPPPPPPAVAATQPPPAAPVLAKPWE